MENLILQLKALVEDLPTLDDFLKEVEELLLKVEEQNNHK